jgi:hypothetical protein
MKGDGFYNKNAHMQADAMAAAIPLLQRAADCLRVAGAFNGNQALQVSLACMMRLAIRGMMHLGTRVFRKYYNPCIT